MRRRSAHTTRSHGGGLHPLHVFTGRKNAGTLLPPVRSQLILRWSARACSVLVLGFLLAFALGTGLDPTAAQGRERLLLTLLGGTCLGLVLAWRWEGWGGTLSLLSLAAFHLLEWAATGKWPGGWAFPVLALPGALFVSSHLVAATRR